MKPNIINDLKKIDVYQFAKVTKTTFVTIGDHQLGYRYNWLKIPKGSIIGLLDDPDNIPTYSIPRDIRIYAPHGNTYLAVSICCDNVKKIRNK